MADIARIEDRIDRVAASTLEVSDALGVLRFQNMVEVMEFAKCMAIAETAVPKHLRGNPGMCLAVCIQALEWRFSPFAVANKSYVVNDRIGYESQLVHAVIEQRAPITGRLKHRFDGEGDDRRCIVTATLRETGETLEYISPPFGKIQPKNSPLWKTKPDLQLYYNTSRDFCRAYFPDVLLGVYSAEELRDHVGPDNAKDVTKPDVASRLKGGRGRGFSQQHVERETRGGVIEEHPTEHPEGTSGPARETSGSGDVDLQSASGTLSEPPTNSNSSQAHESPQTAETDMPASEPSPPAKDAGTPIQESSSAEHADDGEVQTGESGGSAGLPSTLPEGWPITYAAALRRAQKVESLAKYATQYWAQYGGWDAHKDGPDAVTAKAIFDTFKNNFGRKDVIESELRELI